MPLVRAPVHAVTDDVVRGGLVWTSLIAGALAVLCALFLPFAPVTVNQPQVSWPLDPARPASTSLMLNAAKPLVVDLTVSGRSLQAAASTSDGVVLSTLRPTDPSAIARALVMSVVDGQLVVRSAGEQIYAGPRGPSAATYTLHIDSSRTVLDQNGSVLASVAGDLRPGVDSLVTSIVTVDGGSAADLSVVIGVDDTFSSSPTPAKLALVLVMLLSAVVAVTALARTERGVATTAVMRRRRWWRRVSVVDVAVVGVAVLWLFVGPMTDDDGYYSAMAANVPHEGYVAQYYQLFNQAFTPFSWFYYALAKWQAIAGFSPAVLRVPALMVGLGTWAIIRVFVGRQPDGDHRRQATLRVVLAVVFLAWWLPFNMGVRPEAVVAFLAAGSLLAVVLAVERSRLAWAAVAVGLAGLACACHPTGFVALAPLIVAGPRLLRLVREGGGVVRPAARMAAVLSTGGVAAAAAFADCTYYDFSRGQQIFLGIQDQNDWRDEFQRYNFLLSDIPMGSYAKRAAVLVALLALGWFAVLSVAARVQGTALPPSTTLAGWATGLSFLLLWLTPSKWTHHFGALSGVGAAFLTLFLVGLPGLTRQLVAGRKLPWGPLTVAALSVVLVIALAGGGPNTWAYNWLTGMPHAVAAPFVSIVQLGSPVLWVLGFAGLVVLLRRRTRSEPSPVFAAGVLAVPVLVCTALVATVVYLVGSFTYASVRTLDTWSPGAASLTDPLSARCDASGAVDVADTGSATELESTAIVASNQAFELDAGFYAPDPPAAPLGKPGGISLWGSLQGDGATSSGLSGPEGSTGSITTPWFSLPAESSSSRLVVVAAGSLSGGNSLTAEYSSTTGPATVRTTPLDDGVSAPAWRTFVLAPQAGENQVRLVAQDGSTGMGGWLSFSAPAQAPLVSLQDWLPAGVPVAVSWQLAFNFPCQRKPIVEDGITERSDYGVVWGQGGINGLNDNTWQLSRGGLFGPITDSGSETRVAAGLRDFPSVDSLQVYRFDYPYAARAYTLTRGRETVSGLTGP